MYLLEREVLKNGFGYMKRMFLRKQRNYRLKGRRF
jgi:hypothetical protein